MAARLLHNCESKGKTVTAGNIAYYAMLHTRSGRRFNYSGRSDVMSSRAQLAGHSPVLDLRRQAALFDRAAGFSGRAGDCPPTARLLH